MLQLLNFHAGGKGTWPVKDDDQDRTFIKDCKIAKNLKKFMYSSFQRHHRVQHVLISRVEPLNVRIFEKKKFRL